MAGQRSGSSACLGNDLFTYLQNCLICPVQERIKFKEETLVNVDGRRKTRTLETKGGACERPHLQGCGMCGKVWAPWRPRGLCVDAHTGLAGLCNMLAPRSPWEVFIVVVRRPCGLRVLTYHHPRPSPQRGRSTLTVHAEAGDGMGRWLHSLMHVYSLHIHRSFVSFFFTSMLLCTFNLTLLCPLISMTVPQPVMAWTAGCA